MARKDVVTFFKAASKDSSLQEKLKVKSLEELLVHAKDMGYDFTTEELAIVVEDIEELIAKNRGEKFEDPQFSLWRTMWGKYYFNYVVENVINSLSEKDLEQFESKS